MAEQSTAPASFAEGELSRHVLRLSGVMILSFLSMTLAQLVEAVYLGLVGTQAIAAVTFTFPVLMAIFAATRGIGIGCGAILARAMGAGDRERAAFFTTHGLLLLVAFNLVCAVLLFAFAGPLFHLLGARGEVHDMVVAYIRIAACGLPMFGVSMASTMLMRSIGDAVYPGYVIASGSLLQVALGPFLIFGWAGLPAMGVEGAAWSLVGARSASFLIALYWFFVKARMIRAPLYRARHGEPSAWARFADSCRGIFHVGAPAMAGNLVEPLSTAIVTPLMATFGTAVVAGFGIASRMDSVLFMVAIGISSSAAPLVGQNWGARRFDRAEATVKLCYRYCLIWGAIAGAAMWLAARPLVSLVNDDPEVVATATSFLYIVPITVGFAGMVNVAVGAFNALSRPWPPLALSLLRLLALYVPLAFLASRYFGYVGVFAAAAFANVVLGLWGRAWNRRVFRQERARAA